MNGLLSRAASLMVLACCGVAAGQVTGTPGLKVEEVATGLRAPWGIVFLPDGRVWVTEREGRVREIRNQKLVEAPVATLDVKSWTKMGLMGIELDPAFVENHFVYLAENYEEDGRNFMKVVRYREEGGKLIEPTRILVDVPAWLNHTGGRIKFGPDGKLYVTTGDADRPRLAQDLSSLAGKILRINSDGSVPADNPFVGKEGARDEIWSYGHRNPQGIAWDKEGRLWEAEHGPDGGDEVNLVRKGENYGWPEVDHDRQKEGMVGPVLQYTPSIGPAAVLYYSGSMFPQMQGDVLVGMMRGEGVLRVEREGSTVTNVERLLHRKYGRIREIAAAPDGAIWITTSEFDPPEGRQYENFDKVLRLTPDGTAAHGESMVSETRAVGAPAIYAQSCRGCHGDGGGSLNSNLFDGKWLYGDKDEDLRRMIHDGRVDRGMPRYAERLSGAEIEEMVKYLREREGAARK